MTCSDLQPVPIVIVGGTTEARRLAQRLGDMAQLVFLTPPRDGAGAAGTGPVVADLARACRAVGAGFLVDGTHPCDGDGGRSVLATGRALDLPVLRLERPGWRPGRGDRWVMLRRPEQLPLVIPRGARVLVTTGRDGLDGVMQLKDVALWVRQVSPGGARARVGRRLTGPAPFTVAQELRVMRRLGVTWLVLRNAGGPGGWPKLAAARRLGLQVALLQRPDRGLVPTVTRVKEAEERIRAWLRTAPTSGAS